MTRGCRLPGPSRFCVWATVWATDLRGDAFPQSGASRLQGPRNCSIFLRHKTAVVSGGTTRAPVARAPRRAHIMANGKRLLGGLSIALVAIVAVATGSEVTGCGGSASNGASTDGGSGGRPPPGEGPLPPRGLRGRGGGGPQGEGTRAAHRTGRARKRSPR